MKRKAKFNNITKKNKLKFIQTQLNFNTLPVEEDAVHNIIEDDITQSDMNTAVASVVNSTIHEHENDDETTVKATIHMVSSPQQESVEETNWERQRRLFVEENNRILMELGLLTNTISTNTSTSEKTDQKTFSRKKKRICNDVSKELPRRSSRRLQEKPALINAEDELSVSSSSVEVANHSTATRFSVSLGEVILSATHGNDNGWGPCENQRSDNTYGLCRLGNAPKPHIVYSLAFEMFDNPSLLAAAGGDGMVSLFNVLGCWSPRSFRLHSRWVSDVQFSSTLPLHLLSASDDRTVIFSRVTSDGSSVIPIDRCNSIHNGGIFSMAECGGVILTASKDSSIGVTHITPTSLRPGHIYSSVHSSVVKCVRWREEHEPESGSPWTFASCGNDRFINVWDHRTKDVVLKIDEKWHTQAVNSVVFSNDPNQILTSSFDKSLSLFDLRHVKPVFQWSGHHANRSKASLTPPAFFRCNNNSSEKRDFVMTTGSGTSDLYIYNTVTGKLDLRIDVGFTPTSVCVTSCVYLSARKGILWKLSDSKAIEGALDNITT